MCRRAMIWLTGCGAVAGAAWLWLRPAPSRLSVSGPAEAYGMADPSAAARTRSGRTVLDALVRFAPAEGQGRLRPLLANGSPRADFAFAPGRKAVTAAVHGQPAPEPALTLPSEAVLQGRGVDDCFLLMRFEPASGLLDAPARRRWMGGALAEAVREARSATVAVGEESPPARTVATIALEFADGARAEAALRRLTSSPPDGSPVTFTATPGAATSSRLSGLVVIRLEADVRLVNASLGR
ncbi:MAG: hypothetical protein ACO3ND_02745 [Opitutales bacterium]